MKNKMRSQRNSIETLITEGRLDELLEKFTLNPSFARTESVKRLAHFTPDHPNKHLIIALILANQSSKRSTGLALFGQTLKSIFVGVDYDEVSIENKIFTPLFVVVPTHCMYLILKSISLLEDGKTKQAIKTLGEIEQLFPGQLYQYLIVMVQGSRFKSLDKEKRDAFKKAIPVHPDDNMMAPWFLRLKAAQLGENPETAKSLTIKDVMKAIFWARAYDSVDLEDGIELETMPVKRQQG
jgi:hypothetical protein